MKKTTASDHKEIKEALKRVMEDESHKLNIYKDFDDSVPTAEEVISSAESKAKQKK